MRQEASIFWRETGIAWPLPTGHFFEAVSPLIVHYKTTGMTLNGGMLSRFAAGQGWDVTAAHYGAGVKALTGRDRLSSISPSRKPRRPTSRSSASLTRRSSGMARCSAVGRCGHGRGACAKTAGPVTYQPHHRGRAAALVRERRDRGEGRGNRNRAGGRQEPLRAVDGRFTSRFREEDNE